MSNQAVLKQDEKNKDFKYLYFKNVPVVYASVQEPKEKYQSTDKEYAATIFINEETKTFLEEEALLNKTAFLVGVDKNKKRKIKYPLTSQMDGDKESPYDNYEGLYGISLTAPEFKKNGDPYPLKVVDENGAKFTDLIGNGSICSFKCFGYINKDELLNIQLQVVQVLEHVPYEGGSSGLIEDDELGITLDYSHKETKTISESVSTDVFDDDIPF